MPETFLKMMIVYFIDMVDGGDAGGGIGNDTFQWYGSVQFLQHSNDIAIAYWTQCIAMQWCRLASGQVLQRELFHNKELGKCFDIW